MRPSLALLLAMGLVRTTIVTGEPLFKNATSAAG
jgi:hypothetical protein